jgi:hypothetical protein
MDSGYRTFILSTSSRTLPYMALLFTPLSRASASASPSGSAPCTVILASSNANVDQLAMLCHMHSNNLKNGQLIFFPIGTGTVPMEPMAFLANLQSKVQKYTLCKPYVLYFNLMIPKKTAYFTLVRIS